MKTSRTILASTAALALVALPSCINIYISFPEAAVREAAGEIVDEVRPDESTADADSTPPSSPAAANELHGSMWNAVFGRRVAHAEAAPQEKKLRVTGPVVKRIKAALKARYEKLKPYYENGAVGENLKGYIAERDIDELQPRERALVKRLIKEENDDRKDLYEEILRLNDLSKDDLEKTGRVFAKEWQEKCKPGWWVETKDGWKKKPAEE